MSLIAIYEAYLEMAKRARYRPAAPGDGWGHITLSEEQLVDPRLLEAEAISYAQGFLSEEDERTFWIGCSDFETNRALAYVIEAARCLCGGSAGNATALRLLRMAIDEINAETKPTNKRKKRETRKESVNGQA